MLASSINLGAAAVFAPAAGAAPPASPLELLQRLIAVERLIYHGQESLLPTAAESLSSGHGASSAHGSDRPALAAAAALWPSSSAGQPQSLSESWEAARVHEAGDTEPWRSAGQALPQLASVSELLLGQGSWLSNFLLLGHLAARDLPDTLALDPARGNVGDVSEAALWLIGAMATCTGGAASQASMRARPSFAG